LADRNPPGEVVTSPESRDYLKFATQVTITADEPCTYLYWSCDTVRLLMLNNSDIALLMDCLIGKSIFGWPERHLTFCCVSVGKDISEKLYSVAEQQATLARNKLLLPRLNISSSSGLWSSRTPLGPWQDELLRSQSVDQIYTAPMGQVRSHHWRRNQLRLTWQRKYQKLVPSSAEGESR